MEESKYKVSVIITSYNHADTLRRAIDSVLMQKTTFPVQVIVVDDGSDDGSQTIIRQYYNEGKLSAVICGEHYGIMTSYKVGFSRCQGEYICFCDCDDYKTVNNVFQKQVEYMDANPDCGICSTLVYEKRNGVWKFRPINNEQLQQAVTFDSLLRGCSYWYAQGYCIRRSAFERYIDFSKFARMFHVWDLPISLELITKTSLCCLNFYSAVFVVYSESFTQTHDRWKRLKYIFGSYKIRLYFILKYGCRFSTILFLCYRFTRDVLSVILHRWDKN